MTTDTSSHGTYDFSALTKMMSVGGSQGAMAFLGGSGAAAAYGGNPFASIGTLVSNAYAAATHGSGAGAGANPFAGGV